MSTSDMTSAVSEQQVTKTTETSQPGSQQAVEKADKYDNASKEDDKTIQLLKAEREPEVVKDEAEVLRQLEKLEWILKNVGQHIICKLDSGAIGAFRCVCKQWEEVANSNLEVVRPSKAKIAAIIPLFPRLTTVDLSACPNVRNRNLEMLGTSNLKVKTLVIGQACMSAYLEPYVTNVGLDSIALLTGLHTLSLWRCGALTDNGLMSLSTLTRLTSLAINHCDRITDRGFAVVKHLTLLQSVSMYQCPKVRNGILRSLSCLKSLSFLQLGYTKVSEEGIALFRNCPALVDVRFFGEKNITAESLAKLAYITNLTGLSLACCGDHVTEEVVLKLVTSLPRLRFLDLQKCAQVGDNSVAELAQVAKHIDFLQLQGTGLGERGLRSLIELTSLRRLALESTQLQDTPLATNTLLCVSVLTQLIDLEIRSFHFPPELLQAVGKLRKLQRVSLSNTSAPLGPTSNRGGSSSSMGTSEDGEDSATGFLSLACCTHLTSLIFSNINVRPKEVANLIEQLPLLSDVQLTDCHGEEELAKKGLPGISLHIHTRQLPPLRHRPHIATLYPGSH